VAFALRADGWYLRQDIIWHKPNPMPESVRDSCTKAHEYIFLLSKSQKYYFDNEAIAEPLASASIARLSQTNLENQKGSDRVPGKTNGNMKAVYCGSDKPYIGKSTKDYGAGGAQDASATKARIVDRILSGEITTRNKRSVWTVTTKPYKGAHFATFPPDLITPCILAGAPAGGVVLDPFMGSGTTAAVAIANGRNYLGCELNPAYKELQDIRIRDAHLETAQMELI
jgi:DNA modification methylase